MNILYPLRYHTMESLPDIVYDKIVDRSDFKRGQDKERAARLTADTGSTTNGVYDFPDGKYDEKKAPTDVELALRNGKLDKADVDTLKRLQVEQAEKENSQAVKDSEQSENDRINDERQKFIDDKMGFSPSESK